MDTKTIKKTFIDYFKEHGHKEAVSSSLIPDEPTLLLTNAGMVQMMPYLLNEQAPPHIRMCSIQKCFRTVDIDDVGKDGRHLTFFEMLGSWSFGDYYKRDAIHLALALLIHKYHFQKANIWVSVFKGENGIPEDTESIAIWKEEGISEHKIVKLGWKDNFWGPPGETGPCGPSTEIYYDMGEDLGCKKNTCAPGCDCDRFLEIWNAGVFMEYYKDAYGNFSPLPQKNVDTGAGLERMAAFLQGKKDVFDTDLLSQIVSYICSRLAITDYQENELTKTSIKIITDHIRAVVFLIADGITPSNEHRGYILRKLLRRALTQVRIHNGESNLLIGIAECIITLYSDQYPNLNAEQERIKEVITLEESKFINILNNGIKNIEKIYHRKGVISGEDIFKLQDTFGLPPEISLSLMKGKNIPYNSQEWERLYHTSLEAQKQRSRIGSTFTMGKVMEDEFKAISPTIFSGYASLKEETATVTVLRTEDAFLIVLEKTPMYAESGGQAGDTGTLALANGAVKVTNVKKTKRGVFVHIVERNEETDSIIQEHKDPQHAVIEVDEINRRKASYNHTATHLLHYAVRKVLGQEALQKGSFLNSEKLRFDFVCDREISQEEVKEIEHIVNHAIEQGSPVKIEEMEYTDAKRNGAIGLFENKYGKMVRTVLIGDYSFELCGGTHASRTDELGRFKIVKVESISKGIKRIRAILA